MSEKERIKRLGNMFRGMQVDVADDKEPIVYVRVAFPQNWIVGEETVEKFGVQHAASNGEIYFYCDLETGSDALFDAIFYNIEQNKQAQEKAVLFEEKVNELRKLFSNPDNNVERLKTLKFTMDGETAKLPEFKGKRGPKKAEEKEVEA